MSQPIRAAIIGHPVQHSLSPLIYEAVSQSVGIPFTYEKLDIVPSELKAFVNRYKNIPSVIGWNVTIPHKQTIVSSLDCLSPEAQATQAVNVVKVEKGKTFGFNTDIQGVRASFREYNVEVRGKSVVVLGSGGAAMAACYAVGMTGAEKVWIAARNLQYAERCSIMLNSLFPRTQYRFLSLAQLKQSPQLFEPISIYIQATPLGMEGFPSDSLLPQNATAGAVAFDLVYKPQKTPFLDSAVQLGLLGIGGLDMLIWQAISNWEIWIGPLSGRTELKAEIKRKLKLHLE
jgi:shikimate dehydrogenase